MEAHRQADEAKRQADVAETALVASTRAWLDVTLQDRDIHLEWDDLLGAVFFSTAVARNDGNSPALSASVTPFLATERYGDSLKITVKDRCLDAIPVFGNTLPIKEDLQNSGKFLLPWADIRKAQDAEARATGSASIRNFAFLYVIVCATYKVIGDQRWHHNAVVYTLGERTHHVENNQTAFLRVGVSYNADGLQLRRELIGDYTD